MPKWSQFKPAWWLRNCHLQTIWSEVFRRPIRLPLYHERFLLACGDSIDLRWSTNGFSDTVILLHGLGGTADSSYMSGMAKALNRHKFNTIAMHFRGCGRMSGQYHKIYHGGQTCDLIEIVNNLKIRNPHGNIFAVGFSIGANILLKYLGEEGHKSLLSGAVAVSTPFRLAKTSEALSTGIAQVYQAYLLNKLKATTLKKLRNNDINLLSVLLAKNMREFDNLVTVPSHGFADVDDYYERASSFPYLKSITVPTLVIQSKDDPFLPASAIPTKKDISDQVELLITDQGGHVGFVSGDTPLAPEYWLEHVVPAYLLSLRTKEL